MIGEPTYIFLQDEIPRFGSGWRKVWPKIGTKWVRLKDAVGRNARIKPEKWNTISKCDRSFPCQKELGAMENKNMSGSELVKAYNDLIDRFGSGSHVKRFASLEDGQRRIAELEVKLNGQKTPINEKGDRWYGILAGSNRDKLRLKLQSANGPVPLRELIKAVYGNVSANGIGGVIKGLEVMLKKSNAPFKIVKTKNEHKEACFEIVQA